MSPRWDFRCPLCNSIRENVWVSSFRDATDIFTGTMIAPCECGGTLEKMPAAPNFSIGGYNARNSYGVKSETK